MRTNYLTRRETENLETVVASMKEAISAKVPVKDMSDKELVEAGTFIINDYIRENPDVLSLSDLLFNPGQVNASSGRLEVELGWGGEAYMHDPGSDSILVNTFIDRVSSKLNRFSWYTKVDVKAMRDQNLVKLLEDAAEIRYKLFLRKFKYIWDLIAATIVTGQPIYISAATVNKTNLDSVMNTMLDVAGGINAIVGRQSLITQIQGFSGWSMFTLRDIEQGIFGQYRGAKLIGIQDVQTKIIDGNGNEFNTSHIPANQLILVGNKCGFDGGNSVETVTGMDIKSATELSNTFFDYTAIIVDARKIGVYNIA